jgi:DNA-binding SARP family transcriptional activator
MSRAARLLVSVVSCALAVGMRSRDNQGDGTTAWERGGVAANSETTSGLEVCVLGTFRFRAGGSALPAMLGGSQRLLALLALRDRALMRASVAGTLWPESSEDHAHSSLRSALGRLSRLTRDALVVTPLDLCLADGVTLDIRESRALAHRVLDADADARPEDLSTSAVAALSLDVLPDWYEDWLLMEGEEWRQLRLHALEAVAERLLTAQRFGEATGAALAAIRAEPLRESARGVLIRVHLAEGNQSEALAEFARYSALLQAELGLEPTPRLRELIGDLGRSHG